MVIRAVGVGMLLEQSIANTLLAPLIGKEQALKWL